MSHRLVLALAALLSALPPVAAGAAEPQQAPAEATVLQLSENAARQMPRDELFMLLRVEVTADTARDAQSETNRRMAVALDEARKVTAVKVQTPSMDVGALNDSDKRWKATQTLLLRSKDFTAALALLAKLEDQGLLVSALHFDVSEDAMKGVEDTLTAEALKRLRGRAETVAADMGLMVDHVRTLSVGGAGDGSWRGNYAASLVAAPATAAGEAQVSVNVNAEVWLKPKR